MDDLSTQSDDCNCFAFRQAARFVTQIYERHLAPFGLTPAQFTILNRIAKSPYTSMAKLSHSMVMERTSLVRALTPLQRDGMVATARSDRSRTAQLYMLTPAGKSTLAKAFVAWQLAQAEFEGQVGHDRATSLRNELFELTASRV